MRHFQGIPIVTDTDRFGWALLDYERDGDRAKLMSECLAVGLPADHIRWLVANRGRSMAVCDVE